MVKDIGLEVIRKGFVGFRPAWRIGPILRPVIRCCTKNGRRSTLAPDKGVLLMNEIIYLIIILILIDRILHTGNSKKR